MEEETHATLIAKRNEVSLHPYQNTKKINPSVETSENNSEDKNSILFSHASPKSEMEIRVESQFPLSPNAVFRRTFFDRTFSKVGKGSLRGSIFSLCASAIGSGVLSLPYVLALNGWLLGMFFIMIGAVSSWWSNKILARLAIQENLPNLSKLTDKAGGPILTKFLQWMILIYTFGSCISYQIIITGLIKYLWMQFD
jgi:hypothetical protein